MGVCRVFERLRHRLRPGVFSGRLRKSPTSPQCSPLALSDPRLCLPFQTHPCQRTPAFLPSPLPNLPPLETKVVRKRLAVNEPYLMAGGVSYEEGEGLEEDEVAENAAKLPVAMRDLPGGGLGHGAVLTVMDQSQGGFSVEVIVTHRVGIGVG